MSGGCGKVDQLGHGMAAECGKEAFGRVYLCDYCQGVMKGSDLVKMDSETVQTNAVIAVEYHDKLVFLLREAQNVWGEYLTTGGGSPVAHSRFVKAARKFIDESQALLAALEAERTSQ